MHVAHTKRNQVLLLLKKTWNTLRHMPGERTEATISAEDLNGFAEALEHFANRYRELANCFGTGSPELTSGVSTEGTVIRTVSGTGMKTMQTIDDINFV